MLTTTWEVRSYDVWGNAEDGWEVNDSHVMERAHEIILAVEIANPGTPHAFAHAFPTDEQIREAFGCTTPLPLELDGDDVTIYITRRRDGYPLGEMHCTSHRSLSPIRV